MKKNFIILEVYTTAYFYSTTVFDTTVLASLFLLASNILVDFKHTDK